MITIDGVEHTLAPKTPGLMVRLTWCDRYLYHRSSGYMPYDVLGNFSVGWQGMPDEDLDRIGKATCLECLVGRS